MSARGRWRVFLLVAGFLLGTPVPSYPGTVSEVLFEDDFRGPLTWTVSSPTVTASDGEYLRIDTGGGYNDYAEATLGLDLTTAGPVVLEQRMKLVSGGQGYRLPWQTIFCEDGSRVVVSYLPSNSGVLYGWAFGDWHLGDSSYFTGIDDHPVPDAGYWAVTRIEMTPTGGTLSVRPDDADMGWTSDEFHQVATASWSHSRIEKVRFDQPWDSVNLVDYFRVTAPVVDATPPSISVTGLPGELWPANHAMVRIYPNITVSDDHDPAPVVTVAVSSSEPDSGLGDGDTSGDIVVHSPVDIELRAERSGTGSGRTYTLVWTATDACGNAATFTATVVAPKSQGKSK